MILRSAALADLEAIAAVEAACFPPAEAATREQFRERLASYASHFWLLFEDDHLVSFIDGFVTDASDLTDDMYENASLHDEKGSWQMIFGVNTLPAYRYKGYASRLIRRMIASAQEQHRLGLVLTCKETLVPFYASFGFVSEGITPHSVHGGCAWVQMRLTFPG